VALTPDTLTFHTRARSQAVTIEVQDSSGAKLLRTPTLTIVDTTVARFSSSNNVLAVADGITRLVGAVDGVADTAVVRVDIVPARIVPTPATLAIGSHAPRPVRATVTDSLSQPMTGFTFTYTSSDTSVITVSADGEVTPHAEGTAQVRIEAAGLNTVVPITVRYVLAGVVILPNPLTFYTLNRPQRARLYSIDSVYTVLGLLADTIPGSPRRIRWAAFGSWYTFVPADTGVDVYPIWSYEDGYLPLDAAWLGTFEGYASIIVRLYPVTLRLEGPKTDLAVGESTLFTRVARDSLDNDLEGRIPIYYTNEDWSVVTIEDGPNPWTISVRALQPGSSWVRMFGGGVPDSVLITVH